jgi:hypothetical protein
MAEEIAILRVPSRLLSTTTPAQAAPTAISDGARIAKLDVPNAMIQKCISA